MNNSIQKVTVSVPSNLMLESCRPNPLLMHISPPDVEEKLFFWNQVRDQLKEKIEVTYFDKLEQAGPVVMVPHYLKEYWLQNNLNEVQRYGKRVLDSGRKLVSFAGGPDIAPLKGEIHFAESTYRTKNDAISVPLWGYDYSFRMFSLPKPDIPSINFVANTHYPGLLSNMVQKIPLNDKAISIMAESPTLNRMLPLNGTQAIARLVRQRVCKALKYSSSIHLHLKERKGNFFSYTEAEQKRMGEEYVNGLLNHAYSVCVRGDSNALFQLYETLAVGRIPVFIDTNTRLPELPDGSWDEFCVIVPFKDIDQISTYVRKFHDSHSESEFQHACQRAREVYEMLLPHNYVWPKLLERLQHSS